MKSLKHIFGLLMMGAMIIAAGCNKEENGGKKENLPHPNSTYKACPILAHFGNEKLGIKEINMGGEMIFTYDIEQRLIKGPHGEEYEYQYDKLGRLITVKNKIYEDEYIYTISYDAYGFIDSIYEKKGENIINCRTFKYSNDTVLMEEEYEEEEEEKHQEILKFSDDLYVIYSADADGKWWCRFNWENGNLISWYDNTGDKNEYKYDNHIGINRLLYRYNFDAYIHYLGRSKSSFFTKNNITTDLSGYIRTYTYDDKGMVKSLTDKNKEGVIESIVHFTYIYY